MAEMQFNEALTLEERKKEIDRLMLDQRLLASQRQRQLILFICNEELEGRGDRLKAFTIATQVLGRTAEFDPQSDSIVRVEIGRIRQLLELYYSRIDPLPKAMVVIPKRTYRPVFVDAQSAINLARQKPMRDWFRIWPLKTRPSPGWSATLAVLLLTVGILTAYMMRYYVPMQKLLSDEHQMEGALRHMEERRLVISPIRVNVEGQQGAVISALFLDKFSQSLSENLKFVKIVRSHENIDGLNIDMVLRTSLFIQKNTIRVNYIAVDAEKSSVAAQGNFEIMIDGQINSGLGDTITMELNRRLIAAFARQSDQVTRPSIG